VWALSLSGTPSWSQLLPAGAPPAARIYHTAIYDPVRDRMLVFGGFASGALDDVWSLSLAGTPEWTELTPSGTPGRRYGQAAIYDPVRDQMIVFGGYTEPANSYVDDVWALSLGSMTWTPLAPSGSPPGSGFRASAVYDPAADRMVVFGGYDGRSNTISAGAFALDLQGSSWTALAPSGAVPPERYLHTGIYDAGSGQLVVFGGVPSGTTFLRDAHALTLSGSPAWSELPTLGGTGPGGRGDQPITIFDSARDRIVTFGGGAGSSATNEVWALSLAGTPTWTRLMPAGTPPEARSFSAGIYDPLRDRLLVFGGLAPGAANDVWSLSLAGAPEWTELMPAGPAPDPRFGHTAIYDPVRDQMVVYGGYSTLPLGDVWTLSLAGAPAWSEISPSGVAPDARYFHTAVYDPVRDRMLIAHGSTGAGNPDDVWELKLAKPAWNQLAPAGSLPGGRYLAAAIYDPPRDRMVLFAGYDASLGPVNGTWELTLSGTPTWSQLVTFGHTPPPRYGHAVIYDPVRDRLAMFGASFYYTDDVRALNLTTGYTVDVTIAGSGSVTKSPDQPFYVAGARVDLTAVPGAGWHFVDWGGDTSATSSTLTLGMTRDRTVTATFAINTYTLTVTTLNIPAASGVNTVTREPDLATYTHGQTVELTAVVTDKRYHFVEWTGDAHDQGNSNPITIVMDGNKNIGATFALTESQPPSVRVLAPNGGETLVDGQTEEIQWGATDNVVVVALYVLLSRSGASGPFDTLANVPSSPGSYGWLVTLPATSGAFIKVVAFDANGNSGEDLSDAPFTIIARSTGAGTAIPRELALGVIFPNPAAGPARIPYDLPREARVRLSVADVQGREMTLLEDRACAAGRHVAIWDGRTRGDRAPAGIYFARLEASGRRFTRRFVLAR